MGRAKVWRRPVTRITSMPWACARLRVARSASEIRNSGLSRVPSISMAMRRRESAGTNNFSIRQFQSEAPGAPARPARDTTTPKSSTSTDHRSGEVVVTPSGHRNRGRRSKGTGRLEVRFSVVCIASPAADQSASRTITCDEFKGVRSRSNRADNDIESAVALNVGRDDAEFNRRDACSYTLPCDRGARTIICLGRELAEGRGKRGAEEVDTHLVQLAGRRAHQFKGHRQFVRRRIHGPSDLACRVVQRFTEVVPACGPLLHCCRRRSCASCQEQYHCHQTYSFHRFPPPGCSTFQLVPVKPLLHPPRIMPEDLKSHSWINVQQRILVGITG